MSEQQPNQSMSREMYTGMIQAGSPDLIKWLESPQGRIERYIKENINGKMLDPETMTWIPKPGSFQVMNGAGEQYWIGIMGSVISTDTVLTRVDDLSELNLIGEQLMARATTHCNLYKHRYKMETTDVNMVREKVSNRIKLTMRKAYKGGEWKFLNLNTTHDIKQVESPEKKLGFVSGLMGMKK